MNPRISMYYDINKDGAKEWIFYDWVTNHLKVYERHFSNPVSTKPKINAKDGLLNIGVRYSETNESQIFIQKESGLYFYSYQLNSYYWMRYLFFAAVYILILSLVKLIQYGQQIQEKKKLLLEKEIASLQLKTIKNNVDPHFVFNAINTISEMTLMENKLEADDFIMKYSRFMRTTLEHSDKISTTITEEVNYTENFIRLQQIRYRNNFKYAIDIENSVNKAQVVPKHIMFTYTENALKHGIGGIKNGQLLIEIYMDGRTLVITIQDNGVGLRKATKRNANGTGNGLKIMHKIFELYESRHQTRIEHNLIELVENGEPVGVKATIKLTPKKEKNAR